MTTVGRLARSLTLAVAVASSLVGPGCAPSGPTPVRPPASEITDAMRSALAARDRLYADKLDALAARLEAREITTDDAAQEALATAREEAAREANAPLAALLAPTLNAGDKFDPARAAVVFRDLARGARRNGKE